jgi:hypothetical protein
MDSNEKPNANAEPKPRLIVKLDNGPMIDLQMKQGDTVLVEYRHGDSPVIPTIPPPPPPSIVEIRGLCQKIEGILSLTMLD